MTPHTESVLRRAGAVCAVSALTFALVSCRGDDKSDSSESETEAPRRTPAASQAPPTTFESDRHSYSIELPTGWVMAETGGTWESLGQFARGAEVPGEDIASSPNAQGFLVANSMTIPDGVSPAEWSAQLLRLTREPGPGCEGAIDVDLLAGEDATIVEHRCEDMQVVGRSVTHAGRGYYFTIGFPTEDAATEATLEEIVASVEFLDS
jgi:hypothetical protein